MSRNDTFFFAYVLGKVFSYLFYFYYCTQDKRVTIHHPDHDEVRIVVGHKEFPPDGLYERYRLKVQLIPLEDPNDALDETGEDEEGYRPGRAIDIARS